MSAKGDVDSKTSPKVSVKIMMDGLVIFIPKTSLLQVGSEIFYMIPCSNPTTL